MRTVTTIATVVALLISGTSASVPQTRHRQAGNVKNSEKGKRPFFNWISADETIATARGGGGGLALWKRVVEEEE